MAVIDNDPAPRRQTSKSLHTRLMQAVASPGFQSWAARFPLTRRFARRDGERLFDLVAGFTYSQVLLAVVQLDLLDAMTDGPVAVPALAHRTGLTEEKCRLLCNAAASLDLIKARRDGRFELARLGAATLGVPGLKEMIAHHPMLYRDLADPVSFLNSETQPELADFWPYVRGDYAKDISDAAAQDYSALMAASQNMVAEETLNTVDFAQFMHVMDVGGGTGAFLRHVRARHEKLRLSLFDLPAVARAAQNNPQNAGLEVIGGSFLEPLPQGSDAISLIRVLYDHEDETVAGLLSRLHDALPHGGHLVVSEPMTGGATPNRSGDVYFSLYTLAMTTGRARSSDQISELIENAGFSHIKSPKSARPFVTSVVTARKA